MVGKLLAGILLVIVAVTVPLVQAGSAAMPTMTQGEVRSAFVTAEAKATCVTLAEKATLRSEVALLALAKAEQAYAKQHGIAAPNWDALLVSPSARGEIMSLAVKTYRGYLLYLGRRLILARGPDCTRAIVALLNSSGLHILAEEELIQAWDISGPDELSQGAGYGGRGGGSDPSFDARALRELIERYNLTLDVGFATAATMALGSFAATNPTVQKALLGAALAVGAMTTWEKVALDAMERAIGGGGGGRSAGDMER